MRRELTPSPVQKHRYPVCRVLIYDCIRSYATGVNVIITLSPVYQCCGRPLTTLHYSVYRNTYFPKVSFVRLKETFLINGCLLLYLILLFYKTEKYGHCWKPFWKKRDFENNSKISRIKNLTRKNLNSRKNLNIIYKSQNILNKYLKKLWIVGMWANRAFCQPVC